MISQVKQYGITSPLLYFVDLQNSKIIMQKLQGQLIRDLQDENLIRICKKVGKIVATLHKNEVMHGDLTTSNFILVNHNKEDDYTHRNRAHNKKASINIDKVAIIDFGLSQKTNRTEDYAVDLRLFKGILYSAHVRIMESGWKRFISGYRTESDSSFTDKVLKQLSYIESRGRYATVV